MRLDGLIPLLELMPAWQRLKQWASEIHGPDGERRLALSVPEAAKPYLLAALARGLDSPLLVVTAQPQDAQRLADQLAVWSGVPERVWLFPPPDALPYERLPWEASTRVQRLAALTALAHGTGPGLVIAPARSLIAPLMSPRDWEEHAMTLRRGQEVQLGSLLAGWIAAGYEPVPLVEESGYFSRRGGVVDIFPITTPDPVRIELFGDEIDSLRLFDPATQRSARAIESVTLTPAREVLPGGRRPELDLSGCRPEVREELDRDLERLAQSEVFPNLELYSPYLAASSLLDFAAGTSLLLVDEPALVRQALRGAEDEAAQLRRQLVEKGELPADFAPAIHGAARVEAALEQLPRRLDFDWQDGDAVWQETFGSPESYGGKVRQVVAEIRAMAAQGGRVVVISEQAQRLSALAEVPVSEALAEAPSAGSVTLTKGSLAEGLVLPAAGLTVLTDLELFGWSKPRRVTRQRPLAREAFLSDISPGDYVVHVEHGIGLFKGLTRMNAEGRSAGGPASGGEREYAAIEYAEGDRLYVPTDQLDRLTRYIGIGDAPPALHRLGSGEWLRVKARAKEAARAVAQDLLNLYATREAKPGYAFGPDVQWQAELEASFPYVETPDQLRAIEEVKADMERPRPMDRLLCGDVGYGKTEVALRAAFKAVMDGKQVAVLVPTTVLAQQHYNTFRERLQPFPTRVEMLSRFCSPKEKAQVLAGLRSGAVDICIGTHRLIQKDVAFKDIGLVIIDEEQRFGVMDKERLKKLRQEVDVLTMTATPIPRTLYMSLSGVRDMSTMDTPPEDRLPIRTHVAQYDDTLVREAVLRELDRGGQVYFVHNRVRSIPATARRLGDLVPEARLAMGHGQMPEEQLEKVMLDFAADKHDMLVCSTIIESGLDIPNVNTIIVNQADHFGLAQLYQLRGRVGRGANRAYAYFLTANGKRLTDAAEKRLRAIFEASDLGSGFRIARRDLEIRGAGNLLGVEQHGQVAAVGLDLYSRLLAEAVQELRGQPVQRPPEVRLDLPLTAHLPPDYVQDDRLRLNLYQRLAAATRQEDVDALVQEMRDRFGPLPQAATNLALLLHYKLLAAEARIKAIALHDGEVLLEAGPGAQLPHEKLQQMGGLRVGRTQLRLAYGRGWLERLGQVLETLAAESTAAVA
ncbi:MAG: transcription-repair coupling factor [Bacteroidetes bacterium]|nr:transcription-repair coupling factor [Bacteroidota bacterium]MCL5026983.1 transcription-repair coupling factor [Chloroflexota bacterium]